MLKLPPESVLTNGTTINSEVFRLGVRLAEAEPTDDTVRWILAGAIVTNTDANMQFALKYANELVKLRPDRPIGYATLGWIYFSKWYFEGDKTIVNARKSVSYYRIYLSRKPLSSSSVASAEGKIKMLEDWLKTQTSTKG